jgi:putative copper export protein
MLLAFRVMILWLHLVGVCIWIGGLVFQLLVATSVLRGTASAYDCMRLSLRFEARFRTVVWPAAGVVLFTGLINLLNTWYTTTLVGGSLPPRFVQVLSVKVLLVVGMVFVQAVHHFAVQPRGVASLHQASPTASELPLALRRMQRVALGLRLLLLSLAALALGCAVLLRGV